MRFDPAGGGQFKPQIKAIMEAESKPLKQMEARKSTEEGKLKLFQEFKTKFSAMDRAIDEIGTFKKLRELKVDLGDGAGAVSVTVDKDKAQVGTYQVQIDQLAARTSALSNGFEDPEKPLLGLGFIVMDTPDGGSAEVFIDEPQGSLRGVASALNMNPNSPVRAAVVRDASEDPPVHRLILSSKKEGAENNITFPEFYFLDGEDDFYLEETKKAQNAVVTVDGFPIEMDSNTIADFLPGVNLTLKQAKPDQPFSITITEDFQKISGKVKEVIGKMNDILGWINKQNSIDQNTDTRGTFAGDTGLQTIEFRLRNLMHEGFPVQDPANPQEFKVVYLNEIGIEFDKVGGIGFKEDKFNKYMEANFEITSELITGPFGLAAMMKKMTRDMANPMNGALQMREQGMRSRIKQIDSQIDMKARQLDRRQQSLVDQFARLEASLSNLQRQSGFLASMPSGGGGGAGGIMSLLG